MSDIDVLFPYKMLDTSSRLANEDSDSDEVAEAVGDDKDRLDNDPSGSHLAEDSKIMRKSADELDSDLEASGMNNGDINPQSRRRNPWSTFPSQSEMTRRGPESRPVMGTTYLLQARRRQNFMTTRIPLGQPKVTREAIQHPFLAKTHSPASCDLNQGLLRRFWKHVVTKSKLRAAGSGSFGSGGFKWQPKDRKKK